MMAAGRAAALIRELDLRPHPEGGHFGEAFRSPRTVEDAVRTVRRPAITAIHFLLTAGECSRWHRVTADEVWHFLEGDPLDLLRMPQPGGPVELVTLGPPGAGPRPIVPVPAGVWQAARPRGAYTLAGCDVGPGFDFADFSLLADDAAGAAALRRAAPEHANLL